MSIYIDNTYLHCFHSFIKVLSCNIKNFTYPENLRIINDKKFLQDKGTGIKVKHIQHRSRVYGYQHSSWVTYIGKCILLLTTFSRLHITGSILCFATKASIHQQNLQSQGQAIKKVVELFYHHFIICCRPTFHQQT